ncbi:hypothetical protein [Chryseobacterium sp. Leaf180]|uniref:hypothetical protein n=1 Tax=Chryseobacterium sp. Leaf180 TaxID=1736289 RepID=UPI000B178A04|nr:hypothetical protein [Chryseobacterium sp. Leaf180]
MKKNLLFICLIYSVIAFAQTKDEALLKECISKMFNEMKNSDGNAILETFHDKAILQTITKDGEVKDENL